jgi:nucleoid DNA-binding protein
MLLVQKDALPRSGIGGEMEHSKCAPSQDVSLPQNTHPVLGKSIEGPSCHRPPKGVVMEENQTATAKKPMNKTEIMNSLSEATGLTKQQVSDLFDELATLIGNNLGEEGPGVFAIPGLLQIKAVRKPATEERKGINPFTKEETIFKAKPAKNVVKISPLKGLKDMV